MNSESRCYRVGLLRGSDDIERTKLLLALLQIDAPWRDFIAFGPGFVALIMILFFLIRMAPTYKEVKLRDLDLRSHEVDVRAKEAESLTALSKVLYEVAVEQRRAADAVKIMQHINSRSADNLSDNVDTLDENVRTLSDQVEKLHHRLDERVNNGTDTATAREQAAG